MMRKPRRGERGSLQCLGGWRLHARALAVQMHLWAMGCANSMRLSGATKSNESARARRRAGMTANGNSNALNFWFIILIAAFVENQLPMCIMSWRWRTEAQTTGVTWMLDVTGIIALIRGDAAIE